jgi:stringent starvation protein B
MQSQKPYLIRALHEWCLDQGLTPYISVAVDAITRVPHEYVKNGEIVFNIGHEATHQLHLGNEDIAFQGRFGGRVFPVVVPVARVAAIYARENGQGMTFEVTNSTMPDAETIPMQSSPPVASAIPPATPDKPEKPFAAVPPEPTIAAEPSLRPAEPSPATPSRPTLTRIK